MGSFAKPFHGSGSCVKYFNGGRFQSLKEATEGKKWNNFPADQDGSFTGVSGPGGLQGSGSSKTAPGATLWF